MRLGAVSVQKVRAAKAKTDQACEEAFETSASRRACILGGQLMVTALASEKEVELDGVLRKRRRKGGR